MDSRILKRKKKNIQFVEKFETSGSGIISSISQTDGIIEVEEEKCFIKRFNVKIF